MPLLPANTHGFNHDARGVGLLEMAYAVRAGHTPRANAALAFHVTEVMEAMLASSDEARFVDITSTCPRPDPLPETFPERER